MAQYMTASNQALITLSNNPDSPTLLSSVGYLVTNTPFDLGLSQSDHASPESFHPSGVTDGTTLSLGQSTTFRFSVA